MTFQADIAKGIDALDEFCLSQSQPTVTSQISAVVALQLQVSNLQTSVTTLTRENVQLSVALGNAQTANADRQKAITAMKAATQGVLTAAGPF